MKITFVLGSGFNLAGGDRVIAIYAEHLQKRGHEVFLVSRAKWQPSLRDQLRSLIRGKGWITVNPMSHFDHLDIPRKLTESYRPVVDADVPDADVVIATWWETGDWVWHLSPSKGVKVHFFQDYEIWGGDVKDVDAVCALPIPKIVIAGWVRDLLKERFNQIPLALILNSVETDKFYAPVRGKQPVPTVGIMYTTMQSKGCDIALEAFRIAKETIPELRLVAFGSAKVLPELPLPKDTNYAYCAPNEQLKDFYSQCDAWLFGTRREGFGLPILEAMACRTPVIGTPAGAAPELLANGGGILVKPEDPEDMAKAIIKVCQMPESEWRVLSDTAYQKATSYSWEDAADRFEAALFEAVSQEGQSGSQRLENVRM
ncbi:glycosyltransferase family 4 protein [Ancylothrix sp. C2]|uniref:glycosyltransferase family 4 protein n=1 Tax=Ancylothrix sp. D3o TaxID=2953691 RepID=UPI0021BB8051|nr:glycosyltransferase family 4 protein [Ancylothrix sp. D3o]MCT7949704.1 glycosyltransferase family 4 protein [Ancylothrix sp. D3o]